MQYIVLKFCKKNYRYPPKNEGYLYYNKVIRVLKDFKVVRDFGIRGLPYRSARCDLDFFFLSASIFLTYGSDLISATRSVMYLRRSSQR